MKEKNNLPIVKVEENDMWIESTCPLSSVGLIVGKRLLFKDKILKK